MDEVSRKDRRSRQTNRMDGDTNNMAKAKAKSRSMCAVKGTFRTMS